MGSAVLGYTKHKLYEELTFPTSWALPRTINLAAHPSAYDAIQINCMGRGTSTANSNYRSLGAVYTYPTAHISGSGLQSVIGLSRNNNTDVARKDYLGISSMWSQTWKIGSASAAQYPSAWAANNGPILYVQGIYGIKTGQSSIGTRDLLYMSTSTAGSATNSISIPNFSNYKHIGISISQAIRPSGANLQVPLYTETPTSLFYNMNVGGTVYGVYALSDILRTAQNGCAYLGRMVAWDNTAKTLTFMNTRGVLGYSSSASNPGNEWMKPLAVWGLDDVTPI